MRSPPPAPPHGRGRAGGATREGPHGVILASRGGGIIAVNVDGSGFHELTHLRMMSSRTFDGRIQLLEYVPTSLSGPPGANMATA